MSAFGFSHAAWRDFLAVARPVTVEPAVEPVSDEARERALAHEYGATRAFPDPYGPDPVVFGPGPEAA